MEPEQTPSSGDYEDWPEDERIAYAVRLLHKGHTPCKDGCLLLREHRGSCVYPPASGRVLSDGERYTLCPDKGCTGTIRDDGSCTSGACQSGRVPSYPKPPLGEVPYLPPTAYCDDHQGDRYSGSPCPNCRPLTEET